MQKHSSPMMRLTKRRAAFRLRHLLDEFNFLIASFPDLHDAFDADELPLAFILRRDSRLTKASGGPRQTISPSPNSSARWRTTSSSGIHSRGGRRKQMSDE
jgi:hypothetical protein